MSVLLKITTEDQDYGSYLVVSVGMPNTTTAVMLSLKEIKEEVDSILKKAEQKILSDAINLINKKELL